MLALDGNLGGVVSACRVKDCQVTHIEVGGVPMAAAEFLLEVYS